MDLFSSFNIKGKSIKNRIVMPPMVCFGWSDNDGYVTDEHVSHYEKRALGGTGLIIIEATCVNKNGRLDDTQIGLWDDTQIDGFKRIADECHKHGAVVLVQIHHAGSKTPASVTDTPVSPSEAELKDGRISKELPIDEIRHIQSDFIKAALRAKKAGLDGIELHGAHGYLINQFMSPVTNKRTDEYGGEMHNRSRFAVEIIKGIREEAGEDFIIGYRMGGNEPYIDNGIEIAKILERCGVDLLHVSAGISNGEIPETPKDFPFNWIVYTGTQIKKEVSLPVIVVNGIRTPEQAAWLVDNGLTDFTAIGRGHLVDSEWSKKAKEKSSVINCLECPKCSWFINGINCPRNRQGK